MDDRTRRAMEAADRTYALWDQMEAEPEPEPLLCWCCAQWFITAPAIDARQRLCARCLNSSPSACKKRHMAQALAVTE